MTRETCFAQKCVEWRRFLMPGSSTSKSWVTDALTSHILFKHTNNCFQGLARGDTSLREGCCSSTAASVRIERCFEDFSRVDSGIFGRSQQQRGRVVDGANKNGFRAGAKGLCQSAEIFEGARRTLYDAPHAVGTRRSGFVK